jgi:trehalose 6-phosphate phosphatase
MTPHESRVWAFDFDGTLSPLVPERTAATMDWECEQMLMELARDRTQVVAIVSSRSLEDLRSRVRLDNVVLIGSSGVEWLLPGGHRLVPNGRASQRLERERRRLWPPLLAFERVPGVELEDKTWSAAIHYRRVAGHHRKALARQLEEFSVRHHTGLRFGPEVAEIQFLPEVNKQMVARFLVALFAPHEHGRNLVYAGDDMNDHGAIRWVLDHQGTAYVVGNRLSVPGANVVPDPTTLARALRGRFQWPPAVASWHADEVARG